MWASPLVMRLQTIKEVKIPISFENEFNQIKATLMEKDIGILYQFKKANFGSVSAMID